MANNLKVVASLSLVDENGTVVHSETKDLKTRWKNAAESQKELERDLHCHTLDMEKECRVRMARSIGEAMTGFALKFLEGIVQKEKASG